MYQNRIGWPLVSTTLRSVFVYLSYLNIINHHHNYLSVRNIQSLVAEEIYYGLIFPHSKQCKTIHDELKTYLLPEQT